MCVSNNSKLTWKLVNEIIDTKSVNRENIKTIINNDRTYDVNEDPKGMSNIFNHYFISVGKKLAERSNYDLKNVVSKNSESLSFDNLFGTKIEAEVVINILNSAKDDTAPGFDRMSIKLLKYVIDYINNPLVYIYNLSI